MGIIGEVASGKIDLVYKGDRAMCSSEILGVSECGAPIKRWVDERMSYESEMCYKCQL